VPAMKFEINTRIFYSGLKDRAFTNLFINGSGFLFSSKGKAKSFAESDSINRNGTNHTKIVKVDKIS
jgi:hypothetical protein